jgi:hypothetical protein
MKPQRLGKASGVMQVVLVTMAGIAAAASLRTAVSPAVAMAGLAWGAVAAIALYPLVQSPLARIWRQMGSKTGRSSGKLQARCWLVQGGGEIDVAVRGPASGELGRFRISFDELSEIRCLTYVEAQIFFRYSIAPGMRLAVRQARDLERFHRGEIARPRVYAPNDFTAAGTSLLLRGDDLLYLLNLEADEAEHLVGAFHARKEGDR